MENNKENTESILLDEENTAVKEEYRKLETLMEVTFTKDEVENFYSKFEANPFLPIFAA